MNSLILYSINEKRTPPNTLSLNKQKDTTNINKEIQHIQGDLNNDLYAVPMKNNSHEYTNELPAGWEKHEGRKYYNNLSIYCRKKLLLNYNNKLLTKNMILDNDGPYYWHIKSGTIQREPPEYSGKNEPKTPLVKDAESVIHNI